jgi:hypothetical protein
VTGLCVIVVGPNVTIAVVPFAAGGHNYHEAVVRILSLHVRSAADDLTHLL